MYFILFLALSIASSAVGAEEVKSSTATEEQGDKEKAKREICLENCRQKAKELPTCHDAACKKDNQEKIKKCENECDPKDKNTSPCASHCIDSAKAQEGPCSENPTCLKNITAEFQTCLQSCKRRGQP